MTEAPLLLEAADRETVLEAIVQACARRSWVLHCGHVRSNHVHAVADVTGAVDRALGYLKARASYALKPGHPERERFWSKHGSTRYLWSQDALSAAIHYVIHEQGSAMAVFPRSER